MGIICIVVLFGIERVSPALVMMFISSYRMMRLVVFIVPIGIVNVLDGVGWLSGKSVDRCRRPSWGVQRRQWRPIRTIVELIAVQRLARRRGTPGLMRVDDGRRDELILVGRMRGEC